MMRWKYARVCVNVLMFRLEVIKLERLLKAAISAEKYNLYLGACN